MLIKTTQKYKEKNWKWFITVKKYDPNKNIIESKIQPIPFY